MGTRSATGTDTRTDKDHPHACGDKFTARLLSANQMGSSPRVWGQESAVKICYRRFGIIPTRVGTSYDFLNLRGYKRDHPHACGDKAQAQQAVHRIAGSSPHVWGQVVSLGQLSHIAWIIPTRVGTSGSYRKIPGIAWDHPHACGDKVVADDVSVKLSGSSPRVWGQVSLAYNTVSPQKDHPHACGDKVNRLHSACCVRGPSPHVWGQEVVAKCGRKVGGIIPTRVGTSQRTTTVSSKVKDHPHTCGDKNR